MDSPELIILDVGHGNCALIKDANNVIVIDCPPGGILSETLEHLFIQEILHILISHSDADHIGGIIELLADENIKIHNVHLNPDAIKRSELWLDVRSALKDAQKRGTKVSTELTTAKTGSLNIGFVNIEVIAPTPELILGGAGGTDFRGKKLTSNSVSAVIGIVHNEHRIAILAGDIDQVGFENLIQDSTSLNADILIFPHHGGKPGSAAFCFARCSYFMYSIIYTMRC